MDVQIADVKKALGIVRTVTVGAEEAQGAWFSGAGITGTWSPSPVRPRQKGGMNEMDEAGAEEPPHQRATYRHAWEAFNPDDQGVEEEPRDEENDRAMAGVQQTANANKQHNSTTHNNI